MKNTFVSCLCVTERRPEFMPWLLWNFDRQTWRHRELVIVDSSPVPFRCESREDIRVVTVPVGTCVGRKRNIALQEAHGKVIAWFDDDDWQHPSKLETLVEALGSEAPYAGHSQGWFLDLNRLRCAAYRGSESKPIFNSAVFRRNAVSSIRFREDVRRASDSHWMRALAKRYPRMAILLDREDLFFWLCHEGNLSNPSRKRHFAQEMTEVKKRVGSKAWGDTDRRLEQVRSALYGIQQVQAKPRKSTQKLAVSVSVGKSCSPGVGEGPQKPPPPSDGIERVSLFIKATVLDVPYLETMTRHMIAQAHYPFLERVILVDRPRQFLGKFAKRPRGSQKDLDTTIDLLLKDRVIDRILEVDTSSSVIREIKERFFAGDADYVGNYAATGGPNYPTLYGLQSMTTDLVLQMDADVFFYADAGVSWVKESLEVMKRDARIWLMMTHPGPPVGPVGHSVGRRNARVATWDRDLNIWRFRHATTRYFLCDRRRLHGRLRFVPMSQSCAPLEQCISRTLEEYGAFRGNLGNLRSWHLHAWYHGNPFPQWAKNLAVSIGQGRVPSLQHGHYDIRLDNQNHRSAWDALLHLAPDGVSSYKKSNGHFGKPSDSSAMESSRSKDVSIHPPVLSRKTTQHNFSSLQTSCPTQVIVREDRAPISVIIPIRDRAGSRVRNALRSLQWQTIGQPLHTLLVSQGTRSDINQRLEILCNEARATLLTIGGSGDPWNKPLALNTGLRATRGDIPYVMTMDADMILAPNFLEVLLNQLKGPRTALVLCRISDLPAHAPLPTRTEELKHAFNSLHALSSLRPCYGSGGIQAARRSFFFDIHGYDEDLLWWGAMDGDLVNRARLAGMEIVWIEEYTVMLHQWHPRKHSILSNGEAIVKAKRAWQLNHALVRSREGMLLRNPLGWGGVSTRDFMREHPR